MRKPMTTPGPWEVDEDQHRIDGIGSVHLYRVVDPDGRVVAEFSNAGCNEIIYEDDGEGGGRHCDIQAMANADLIAAAPELYASLVEALVIARRNEDGQYVQRAEAALAKARGYTP